MNIKEIKLLAESLAAVRRDIKVREEEADKELLPLKEMRDKTQAELLKALTGEGLSSIKTESGENYSRSVRKGIAVTNTVRALQWARENGAYAVDLRLVAQKLKDAEEMPAGFSRVETEFISIRGVKPLG